MADSIRDPRVGPEWLAFYALTWDEPIEHALAYLQLAPDRLAEALAFCRGPTGKRLVPAEMEKAISDVRLFLIGLALAADPDQSTAVNLKFVKRKGRPKRSIAMVHRYRAAARRVLELKSEGYDAALAEVAADTGLDRREIAAWAAAIERELKEIEAAVK